jgi:hypothetical protein
VRRTKAVTKEHLGDMDRLRKLVKLTVLVATTEQFTEQITIPRLARIDLDTINSKAAEIHSQLVVRSSL